MFRKPKKPIQRRVFSGYSDEDDVENDNQNEAMDTEDIELKTDSRMKKIKKKSSSKDKSLPQGTSSKTSLLSFDDEGMLLVACKVFYFL